MHCQLTTSDLCVGFTSIRCLGCTVEGGLCDFTNELTHTCIYTNLGACLGPTSYFGSSNLLYYFCGPTSLLWSFISLYSFSECSSTIHWSSFDFLESSSSLRKVV